MDHSNNILEIDVLKSCVVWLGERGILTGVFSFQGLKTKNEVDKFKAKLNSISNEGNFKIEFTKEGPDLIGISEYELWKIECKGSGGNSNTRKSYFNKALSSVILYYDDISKYPDYKLYLGLALPMDKVYLKELRKVTKALRERLNLWILLYDPVEKNISSISPSDDYKF